MPSAEIWKRVSQKATTLKELKESVCTSILEKKIRYKRHLNKVTMMHREIRSKGLLSQIFNRENLTSIDRITLNSKLCDITYNAIENYNNNKENYFKAMSFGYDFKV